MNILLLVTCLFLSATAYLEPTTNIEFSDGAAQKDWDGKWFPNDPGKTDDNQIIPHTMGSVNPACDDAKTNLTIDWDGSPDDYICFEPRKPYLPNPDVSALLEYVTIPKEYFARHVCMNTTLEYSEPLPTFGPHRPLWARYGEYTYLPRQRWVHNLEHGAVVMLYHPCAHPIEVQILREIVTSCLFRHVITPFKYLDPKQPLAVVTWGKSLKISMVDRDVVTKFIKSFALNGPEKIPRDGQFEENLLTPAKIISDQNDDTLCPPAIMNTQ